MAKAKKALDRFDTNAKRNVPIVAKLLTAIITSVIVSVVGVTFMGLTIFSSGVQQSTDDDLEKFSSGLERTLRDWRDTLEADVMLLSKRPNIAEYISRIVSNFLSGVLVIKSSARITFISSA